MLSDREISKFMGRDPALKQDPLVIDPMPEDCQLQPASIDLRLGNEFKWYKRPLFAPRNGADIDDLGDDEKADLIYVDRPDPQEMIKTKTSDVFVVTPDMFVLATTLERVKIPKDLVARVEGRSSIGRKGLIIHATAGFIDPGFEGHITLEIANLNHRAVVLRAGVRICQLSFSRMDGDVKRPYGHPQLKSKYQGQVGTTTSRIQEER